jgi:GPH family glycoside/pentoside/hexuronide:cation symporter
LENSHSKKNISRSTTRLMFSYGLGDAGTGLVATQFGFFLFKFFISAGLPVIIAGSLLMLIKIWDAINDPLIGWLSDRTKSRWGPRIPWMVAASVPLGFSLAAIWWTPTGSVLTKTIYYAIISIIVMTAYTSINLPFAALSTEISEKTAIRTRLNASRFTGSIIAGLTGLIIAGVVLGSEGSANNEYFLMGKISGCIAVAATLISCWGLAPFAKKARRPSGKVEAITLQFKRIFRNKKFLKVITLYILLWCALQLMQTAALIYVEDVLNVPTYIAKWIPIPFQISALVGLQIWTRVSNKLDRISALNYGAIMWIMSCTAA